MAAPALPASSAELAKALNHVVIGKWCDMATIVVFFFECLITMDMEVELVWKSKWTFTKAMYLINRYSTITDIVVLYFHNYGTWVSACQAIYHLGIALYIVGIYLSESLLILRVAVIWKAIGKQWIFVVGILWAMYSAVMVYMLTSTFLLLRDVTFFTLLPFGGCLAQPKTTLWLDYCLLLIYDITMLAFMAYPTLKAFTVPYKPTGFVKHIHFEGA
ncbi:hypothetical protein AGABI2DRAFT_121238 [Agaricus bisporus var. bisporus H97]|uniref:hypothetical protein n=1 Tax=Agaricus bisporus var. bisporus (strain H97 / ATCC MYA-4626 / FGSC 10389) TaxID=936046 RepID=UPI00029F72FE|nr:hypothetical protein AGABI2DRAFT_121238 [Agaricus bisporus var. bisporus H97]EKV44044.1 hypothetical protein AGABI2DRAFT_121238 [Agaricus bisporus var. bisporus H97]